MDVKATCRACNKQAPAEQFRLHVEMRQMVCPNCFSGKTQREKEKSIIKNKTPQPAGWDAEDEYLKKYRNRQIKEEKGKFKRVPGTSIVNYTCSGCNFSFKYDPFRKRPKSCPYCNGDIPRLKTFSLL